jgi:hypothetical protein
MALLLPHAGLPDAYVGLRLEPVVRGNAIEFLDNVLAGVAAAPRPLLDSSVTRPSASGRQRARRAPLETPEQAVTTLLASEDHGCARAPSTPLARCSSRASRGCSIGSMPTRIRDETDRAPRAASACGAAGHRRAQEPVPASMGVGIGSG